MRLQYIVLVAALSAIASAGIIGDLQSDLGAVETGVAGDYSAIKSDIQRIETDISGEVATILNSPAVQSAISEINAQSTELAKLKSWGVTKGKDLSTFIVGLATRDVSYVSSVEAALPTDARNLVTNVLGQVATATGTASSSAAPSSTGKNAGMREGMEMGVLSGALLGMVGLMAAL